MKKTSKRIIALTLALGLIATGCGNSTEAEPTTENTNTSTPAESTEAKTIVDREGIEIAVPTEVNTIVSLVPSITETLVDLGLGDKIVAVDSFSLPTEGLTADVVELDAMAPDIEIILSLKPDLVIASGMTKAEGADPLAQLTDAGILVTYIPTANTLEDIATDVTFLGDLTGTEERATEIVTEYNATLDNIKEQVAKYPDGGKTVYFEISPAPYIYTFGQGVFLNEIIELLGCENVFADQESWIPATDEEVLARNPEIIFTNLSDDPNAVNDIKSREAWKSLDAVKNDQVYVIDRNASSQPNEFVVECVKEMARIIYPDIELD